MILRNAVEEMRKGIIDADLGCGVCKKRIPTSSHGKRGGGRTIVAFRSNRHTYFMFGFLKNELSDIDAHELRRLKQYAQFLFALNESQISKLLERNELFEIDQ